jgi:flavin reductase (DIM6/NTAB) family NADH-FMN oxidoreductase RutF
MQTHPDRYFYEPVKVHGLAHDPLNAIIAPRPIGWVSSRGQNGTLNLAPYSFFNAFNYKPPIIGFSNIGAKDSLRDVSETREFVWNLAPLELAERMNETSASVPYGIDEFELANLTPVASRIVSVPRVAESPVNFECKVTDIIQLTDQNRSPVQAWLVLGRSRGSPHPRRTSEGWCVRHIQRWYYSEGGLTFGLRGSPVQYGSACKQPCVISSLGTGRDFLAEPPPGAGAGSFTWNHAT